MNPESTKIFSLSEMKDKYIGSEGTKDRDDYEYEVSMDVLSKFIKTAREERNLTQEQFGKITGVQKNQISRIENNIGMVDLITLFKVFKFLKAEINFDVKLEQNFVKIS